MSEDLAIRARALTRSFRRGSVRALAGTDLDVPKGASVAITGASGSGKTTLLHALAGLLPLDAGQVRIAGMTPRRRSEWTRLRRESLGLIFQDDWLLPALTARQNVELAMQGTGLNGRQSRARAGELLERVNAAGFADRRPIELSGGERQRVAVARGLANRPALLFADEPTGELDSVNAIRIADLLFDLHRSEALTLLIVSHDPDLAARCELQYEMRDGRGAWRDGGRACD